MSRETSGQDVENFHDDSYSDHDDVLSEMQYTDDDRHLLGSTPRLGSPWEMIQHQVPTKARNTLDIVKRWVKGPQPPRIYKINPSFPQIQHAPLELIDRYMPRTSSQIGLLLGFYFLWLLTFAAILRKSAFSEDIPGYGSPMRLSCDTSLWAKDNGCGIDGYQCRPFANSSFAFRCPANCAPEKLWNPRVVGDQSITLQPLVVGGPRDTSDVIPSSVYRGDSWICAAAIHAGYINDNDGGCGVLRLTGEQADFPSVNLHGVPSIGFDSYFPQSFAFEKSAATQCRDLRNPLLITSFIFTVVLSLFVTNPAVLFFTIYTGLFFQTALASDPPDLTDYYSLVSLAIKRFLPTTFCAVILYQTSVRRSLSGLTAQVEKTILWLVPAWIGALNNYTFDRWIPIQRLTPHDLDAQAGAITALLIIIFIIVGIALGQAWAFRVEGRMPKYLAIYGAMSASLLLLVAVPGMHVRLHHYILALLLLPGTSFQNRPSLIYQGLLIGLFINGTARWGFASILETSAFLLSGGPLGTVLPSVLSPVINNNSITFTLGPVPGPDKKGRTYYGISALVNDVERLEEFSDHDAGSKAGTGLQWNDKLLQWNWTRPHEDVPYYFRFAYMTGKHAGDYTNAGTWLANGTWIPVQKTRATQIDDVD